MIAKALLIGLLAAGATETGPSAFRFSPAVTEVLLEADSVESFRIDPGNDIGLDGPTFEVFGRLAGYYVTEVGPSLDPEEARLAGQLLAATSSYRVIQGPGADKLCGFEPHHGLRFTLGDTSVVAIICFNCGQLLISAPSIGGGGRGDFDPIDTELRRLVEAVLPTR